MTDQVVKQLESDSNKTLENLVQEFGKIRTGRANASLLDRVMVDYYGSPTRLNQVAQINTPDARLITVQPFDKSLVSTIEKAIMTSDLGLNPSSEGQIIRIPIPPLTEDRRKELVKFAKKLSEEAKVSIRNHRRDANDVLKKQEKDKSISEDELKRAMDQVQKIIDKKIKEVDEQLEIKEKDILTV